MMAHLHPGPMHEHQRRAEQDDRQRRAFRGGLVASLALHLLILAIFAGGGRIPVAPFAAAGERRGSDRAAEGGGMQAIELATPTTEAPVPPPSVPVPAVVETPPPEEEELQVEVPAIALAEGMATAGDPGPRTGPGLEVGDGQGDGGTEAEGRFRAVPPRPRGMIMPPTDRPQSVRGKEVEVWVYVSAAGKVVPDSTRLRPPTGDRRFDRRLREYAAEWVFEAARRDGRAVGEWFRYTMVM